MLELLKSFGMWDQILQFRDLLSLRLDELVLSQVKLRCTVCRGERVWKGGCGRRKNRCPVQRFRCADCEKKFCSNTFAPWYWCKYHPIVIIMFLWGFQQGESIRSLSNQECLFQKRISLLGSLYGVGC